MVQKILRKLPPDTRMYFYIDGVSLPDLRLVLVQGEKVVRTKIVPTSTRSPQLLPAIMKFLQNGKVKVGGIVVAQGGGSFSQARLMCVVLNALAYAWSVPIAVVEPIDDVVSVIKKIPRRAWGKFKR